ncbi:MAG: acylneuraminate cytidylyltransferase family protein [Armatimonadetes bacterium]|nr:acylneuraminate cytidylyltransferase family protein [Armatimonadota bacterium]
MDTNRRVLAIIPARGGSKGIPRKNVRELAGKPLIVWTIEAALRSTLIDRLVVSTDDDEIAEVASAAGAEVIRRPAELAGDTTPTEPALLHALQVLEDREGYIPDAVTLLQCTSPLRGTDTIDECINLLFDSGCDAVMTVLHVQHWYLMGTRDETGRYHAEYDYQKRPRSQDMPQKYRENGAVYVTRRDVLLAYQNRLGGHVRVVEMDPIRSIDIDHEEDFVLAGEAIRGIEIR